jgi:ubiquinone/menaquinone biosynthesis C-methylase UbiE
MTSEMEAARDAARDAVKDAVRRQYGAVGDAYVTSKGHASGRDLARMVELAAPTPSTQMLDIATGGGHVARAFAPYVESVIASDLTPEMLAHTAEAFRTWGLENVGTAIADAEDLPFPPASFELVTCRIAPHHFLNVEAFVQEVFRVLVDGGTFVLVDSTVPEGEDGAFFNRFEKLRDPSHVRSLTIGEWTALLETVGFDVGATETFTKTHDFADWTARSRTSADDIAALEKMLLESSPATREMFVVETDPADPSRVQSFRDSKTLFMAKK